MPRPKLLPFTDKELKLIKLAYVSGNTVETIAKYYGISRETFFRKIKLSPEGTDTLLKAQVETDMQVVQSTLQMIATQKFPVLNIFYLKTRLRWKEPKDINDKSTIVINNNIPSGSSDDKIKGLDQQYKELVKKDLECSMNKSEISSPLSSPSSEQAPIGDSCKPK